MEFKRLQLWGNQFEAHGFKETQEAAAPLLYGKHVNDQSPEAVTKVRADSPHRSLGLPQPDTLCTVSMRSRPTVPTLSLVAS